MNDHLPFQTDETEPGQRVKYRDLVIPWTIRRPPQSFSAGCDGLPWDTLSEEIAKGRLANRTMLEIYEKVPPLRTRILCLQAIRLQDDDAPLQVTQLDAHIRIAGTALGCLPRGRGGATASLTCFPGIFAG